MPSKKRPSRRLRLLLVDDNVDTLKLTTMILQSVGHSVVTANSGRKALSILPHDKVDMIMLDIMMPEMDGFTLLDRIRQNSDAPILMVSALADERSIEGGFLLGADDYIVKPYTPAELFTRLERLTAQLPPPIERKPPLSAGKFSLDTLTGTLRVNGRVIQLGQIESRLMERLLTTPKRPVPPRDLFRAAWEREPSLRDQSGEMVNIAISRLRGKIESNPLRPRYLLVTNGVGYVLNPD